MTDEETREQIEEIFNNVEEPVALQENPIEEVKEESNITPDTRLVELGKKFGKEVTLIRRYKGIDYELILDKNGLLHFKGEVFDTPNKAYNNGIVKHVNGKKGSSGTNHLSQFVIKETGERLQ